MRGRPEYAELHLHTAFSFLDGASLPEELIGRATELGYRWLAITDHDGLYGAQEFARAARAAGIQPIMGLEVTLTDETHLTLLAESRQGYANLCRLVTAAHHHAASGVALDGEPGQPFEIGNEPFAGQAWPDTGARRAPRLDPALLKTHAEGVILLTGCRRGQLARLVDAGRVREAEDLLGRYVAWFGADNVVVELQHNLVYGDTARVERMVGLAERVRLPYAATGNVHYHDVARHRLQDTLVAIRQRATLDTSHRARRPNSQFALRSAEEMARLFCRYPAALRTTLELAARGAGFDLTEHLAYHFPAYHAPDQMTPDAYLAKVCTASLHERYPEGHPNRHAAEARLREELALIARHELSGFFLLHRDLLELARQVAAEVRAEQGRGAAMLLPPGRGRGSSVGSIVCYLIGLSPCDPLAHNLSLGRFLNEDLRSVPDIDLDFPREIRERLIARIHEVYGPDRAALICAFSTYRLRSAVRDVGKALGLPAADLDRIARLSEPRSAGDLAGEMARIPEYASRQHAPPWSFLTELSGELAGFPRHVTQHVGGMVVCSSPLTDLVPMQPSAMEGRWLCQWDKDGCDDAGFVKIDFLALGMLSMVEECLELVAATRPDAPQLDLARIDFTDERIYDMICAGDTLGTFQIESRAQIQTLLKTQPRSLDDLTVQVAIIRPGPIIGGAVSPYVERRVNPAYQPSYDHPLLIPVLEETLGVVLYQDQVIGVAMAMAGFTAGQADAFRRTISRKRSLEAMRRFWEQFRDGALEKGVDLDVAQTVFDKLLGFAEYGFPKAHAASFAVLAYQSCWLKYHYPAEFLCALLNNQPMGFYPSHVLINDGKRRGIRVFQPDVNASAERCTIEARNGVRIGLNYVQHLGEVAARQIVVERTAHGPYRSLADLIRRVPLRQEATDALASVGAFDCFGLGRREALWQIGLFLPARTFGTGRNAPAERSCGRQLALDLPVEQDMVMLPPMPAWDRMAADYAGMGLSPRWHPFHLLRSHLPAGLATTGDLGHLPDGMRISVAGLVVCRQRPGTAKGITFLLLEDEHGLVNVVVSLRLYEERRLLVRGEPFLLIDGELQRRGNTINLRAINLGALAEARAHLDRELERHESEVSTEATEELVLETIVPRSHNYR
ncbi:MAG TPA: error-prone DNA polymerase [Thermomicrobiales bacterium]|nr:error-prone DNA polymerase [Thermomicrobiales bacterium]